MIQSPIKFEKGSAFEVKASLVIKVNDTYKTIYGLGDTKGDASLWLMDNLTELHKSLQTENFYTGVW